MRMPCAVLEHKAAVAIGAFDEIAVTHFQIDARMAQGTADASQQTRLVSTSMISGASTGMELLFLRGTGRIIALNPCLARG